MVLPWARFESIIFINTGKKQFFSRIWCYCIHSRTAQEHWTGLFYYSREINRQTFCLLELNLSSLSCQMEIQQLQIMQEPLLFQENRNLKMFCSCLNFPFFNLISVSKFCSSMHCTTIQDLRTVEKIGITDLVDVLYYLKGPHFSVTNYNDASVTMLNLVLYHSLISGIFNLGHASNICIQSLSC